MKFVIVNGSGAIRNAGNDLDSNTFYDVNIGDFNWNYQSAAVSGSIEVLFTVRNTVTNQNKDAIISIEVTDAPISDFEFTAFSSNDNPNVGSEVPINFNINEITGNSTYKLIFNSNVLGSLKYQGRTYQAGEVIDVPVGGFVGNYFSNVAGIHQIDFTITNANRIPISKTQNETIKFKNIDFEVSSNGGGTMFLNQSKPFNVFLSQTQTNPDITYKVNYSVAAGSTGGGEITSTNGNPISYGSNQDINIGTTDIIFKANAIGIFNINITITDSNNQSKTTSVSFNISQADFDFTGLPQTPSMLINSTNNLNFNISEGINTGSEYEMKFSLVSGTGNIRKGRVELNTNTYYDVNLNDFIWFFESKSIEESVEILFTARNKVTNETKEVIVNIEIEAIDFEFTAEEENANIIIGEQTDIFFNIIESVSSSTNYEIQFETLSNESGQILNGNIIVNPNTPININVGSSSLVFNSIEEGRITIRFTVRNLQTNESKSDTININVNPLPIKDFTFSAISSDNGGFVNNCVDVNFSITEINGDGGPYVLFFESNKSGSFEYDSVVYLQGQKINISNVNNLLKGCYNGLEIGDHNVNFTISNNNTIPKIKMSDVDLNFINYDFNFDVKSPVENQFINEPLLQVVEYTEDASLIQKLKFNSNLKGFVKYNGIRYNQNAEFLISNQDLVNGGWNFDYIGEEEGNHNITYTLTANNGIVKNSSVSLNFNRDCTIKNENFGEWINRSIGNVNGTYTWTGDLRASVSSEIFLESVCADDITITMNIIRTDIGLPSIGAKYDIDSDTPNIRPFFITGIPVVFPKNQNHKLIIETTGNGNIGSREIQFTLSNGVFEEKIKFVQVFK